MRWSLEQPSESVCPFCGSAALPGSVFCDQCGSDLRNRPAPDQRPAAAARPETIVAAPIQPPQPAGDLLPVFPVPITSSPPRQALTGRLVLGDSNTSLNLPANQTEVLIGREDPASGIFPDLNLDPHGAQDAGVSRRHLRIFVSVGRLFAEDLNSVNGSFINRRKLEPGVPVPLEAGDELKLGKLTMLYLAE